MDFVMQQTYFTNSLNKINDKKSRNVLVNTDHGLMIVNRFDSNEQKIGQAQFLLDHGNSSTVEAEFCLTSLKRYDPIILDVGANIGTMTTWFAKTFPVCEIYSFEPQPQIFNMLCGNLAINNLYNVRAFNYGLGSENKTLSFFEPDYFNSSDFGTFSLIDSRVKTTDKKIIVEIKTIDWFVKTFNLSRVDLIKIDAEGMDYDILLGANDTIKSFKPNIFIEHNDFTSSSFQKIKEFFENQKYIEKVIHNNVLFISNDQ